MTTKQKVRMVCSSCGGTEVRRDGYTAWNEETQQWELITVFDNSDCETCGGECSIDEVPI